MKQQVEVFFHSQQPYTYVQDEDLAQYPSGRLDFPNRYFNPTQAHELYNQYHEQYAWADEVGIDGIMTNGHNALRAGFSNITHGSGAGPLRA